MFLREMCVCLPLATSFCTADVGLLSKTDERIRTIPIPTKRPILKEITRVYAKLMSIEKLASPPRFVEEDVEASAAVAGGADVRKEDIQATSAVTLEETPQELSRDEQLVAACKKGDLKAVRRLLHVVEDAPLLSDSSSLEDLHRFVPFQPPAGIDIDVTDTAQPGLTILHLASQKVSPFLFFFRSLSSFDDRSRAIWIL